MAENSSSLSSSASVIGGNSDILRQILLCLPVKSLLVFKSVSTQWLSLISDPIFVRNHAVRNHSLPIPALILQKKSESHFATKFDDLVFLDGHVNASDVPWIDMTMGSDEVHMDIKQSCNGFIYFRCLRFVKNSTNGEIKLYNCIFNPSTKRMGLLPIFPPSRKSDPSAVRNISLSFDPIKSPHYEVVYISYVSISYVTEYHYQIDIYSPETKSWRVSGNAFPAHNDTWLYSGVFWNGSLHWISSFLTESSSLYFNIEREVVKTMPMPPVPDGWNKRNINYFGECRGHLYLIESYDPSASCFDILEMDIDYKGWMVKYRVDLTELTIAYPEMVHEDRDNIEYNEEFLGRFDFSILLVEEGEENSSRLLVRISDKLVSYDLHKNSFRKIHDLRPDVGQSSTQINYRYAHKYIESLASVLLEASGCHTSCSCVVESQ